MAHLYGATDACTVTGALLLQGRGSGTPCRSTCNNVTLLGDLSGVWRLFSLGRGTTALCDFCKIAPYINSLTYLLSLTCTEQMLGPFIRQAWDHVIRATLGYLLLGKRRRATKRRPPPRTGRLSSSLSTSCSCSCSFSLPRSSRAGGRRLPPRPRITPLGRPPTLR